MIETVGQMSPEVHAFSSARAPCKDGECDDLAAVGGDEESYFDRYIPAGEEEDAGLYSVHSLFENVRPGVDDSGLTESEKEMVKELEARDREVRQHEQQHVAAAGEFAQGPPVYTYQAGPDGKMYAVGGSVEVDVSTESDPARNLRKALIIRSAASGVSEMSGADAAVAAKASQILAAAYNPEMM